MFTRKHPWILFLAVVLCCGAIALCAAALSGMYLAAEKIVTDFINIF